MDKILKRISVFLILGVIHSQVVFAQEAAEPVAETPTIEQPASLPVVAAPTPSVFSASVPPSPPPVEPLILKQLREGTPIPIRSSMDQANDTNGDRMLDSGEIKEYIKKIRAIQSKGGRYPTETDVLYHFDKNQDGYMDAGEISALDAYAR